MTSSEHPQRPAVLAGEQHEEWLLDDAIDDTFPASDPVSHGQPGSIVNVRYAGREGAWRHRARAAPSGWFLPGVVAAFALLVILGRRRRDRSLTAP
jgi:hypothetical protein